MADVSLANTIVDYAGWADGQVIEEFSNSWGCWPTLAVRQLSGNLHAM